MKLRNQSCQLILGHYRRIYELIFLLLIGTFFPTCWELNSFYWNFFPPSWNFYLSRLYGESQALIKPFCLCERLGACCFICLALIKENDVESFSAGSVSF